MKMKITQTLTLLTTLIVISLIPSSNSNLIGIDLGTEFFKATILTPRRPFTMMENIQSKTKTPTAIGMKDDERVFGADAIAKKPRFPKQVLTFFHEYLGKSYTDAEVKEYVEKYFISYEMEQSTERGTIDIKINFNKEEFKFKIEEIFGMLFRYIKYLADKFTNSDVRDCVVTVPSFFGYKERQAIVQSVELSKLNLLGIVNENVGAAVQFAQNKHFNNTEYYIFYNMGSSHTQATLVSYLSNMTTKNNKTQEVSKTITVMDEAWDKNLGGNVFTYNLIKHLMKKFDESPQRKGKPSVMNDYKVAERILPAATKYKEILSANKEVPVTILGVDSGMNLETRLTREEFEKINEEDLNKVYEPIERLLNKTGITLDYISQIEMIGGSIRVPRVQEILRSKLGNYSNILGTHMNGDDSVALGAAYICANFSSNFKGAKIDLYHGPNYELKIKMSEIEIDENTNNNQKYCEEVLTKDTMNSTNTPPLAEDCIRKLDKTTTVYKPRRGLDLSRTVSFKHDGDFQVHLYEKHDNGLETLLQTYTVTGVQEFLPGMKREGVLTQPKVSLRFKQDHKGMISLKADVSYEIAMYMAMQTGPTGGTEMLYQNNYTEPLSAEELAKIDEELKNNKEMSEGEKMLLKMKKDVGKKKVQEVKKDLKVEVTYTTPKPLTKAEIDASKALLEKLDEMDRNRIRTMEKRNALESLIYNKKEWLEGKESGLYSKEGETDTASEVVKTIADWYEEDGYSADFDSLNAKFEELNDKFKHFDLRINRHKKREKAIENYHSDLKKVSEDAISLVKSKPWMESHYNTTFLKEVESVQNWFNEFKEKQDKLALHEDPVLLAETIESKVKILQREYYVMARIPKPKEKTGQDNLKVEDFMKNGGNLEEMLRKANMTLEDLQKMMNNSNLNTTQQDTTQQESTQENTANDQKEEVKNDL